MASKLLLAALVGVAMGSVPAPYGEQYPAVAPQYNYQYGVNDPHYGPVFSQQEERDNYNTVGEYRVNLPDGRVQIVSYTAGPEGYVADVRYEGEAAYPEDPAPYKPAPAPYKPAPAPYKPAPAPYQPAPAPYKPAPVAYKPAPAPYKPAPAPYKPAPAPYKPAPAPYKPEPVYHSAPVYKPAPAPYAPSYKPSYGHTPKRYGFSLVTTPAPEAKAAEAPVEEAAPAEVAEEAPATEAAPAARF